MFEDGLLEEDIWEYKSIRKTKSLCQTSDVTSPNAQESNNGKSTPQSNGNRSNRKISEGKDKPNKTKQRPRQRGIQTSLKQDQNLGVSNSDNVVQSQERVPSSAKPKRNCKKQSPINPRPVFEGYCPSCQMPFSLLLVQTPQWHVTECLDSAGTTGKECPDGLLCTSTIPSHYKHYSHFLLAASRAGDHLVEFSPSSLENHLFGLGTSQSISSSSTTEDRTFKDLNRNMGKPLNCCVLLEQSSSNTNSLDVASIKTFSLENIPGIHQHITQFTDGTKQAVSLSPPQETKDSHDQESQYDSLQLNTLVSEADFSDCDISYSPLNTDEQKSTEEEREEEEEEETRVKHLRKRLFAVKSPEVRSGKAGNCVFNKTDGTSQQREPEHNSVELVINDSCETSAIFPTTNEVSKSLSQASISRRILSSTNIPDLVKHTTEEFAPVDYRRSGKEFEGLKLSSSTLSAGECDWSNSNSKVKIDSDVKNKLLPLKLTEESIGPFQHWQAGFLAKSCSIAKTTPNTSGNKLSHNNSYSITEKEGSLSNTIAVPVFPSTVSQTLTQVSAAKLKVQATPAKELKQMDIGVFFGLQPKATMESDQKKNLCEKKQTLSPPIAEGKRSASRKRKAEGLLGDSNVVTESLRKTATPVEPAFGGQRHWRKRFRDPCTGETRKKLCPFYKKIPGTSFVVDAFQYGEIEGCTGYFLTHFHSDHYGGLTKKFTFPIYCNKITGNLVKSKLHVQEQYVHILPMDVECIVNGIKVVLLDANHCPGAAMILFCLSNGTVFLHTGDFRASPSMEHYPFLIGQKVHSLYLDTTYCSPEYTFPSQQEVIQFAVNTAFEAVTLTPRTLVVCGTYSVGKEKVFLAIAEVLGSKVSMSQEKYKTLQCLESAEINSLITLDWSSTLLHLLPMMQINFKSLQNHLNKFSQKFDCILAFKPTGWTYSDRCYSLSEIQPQTRGKITIYGIPYSEHSSFLEMKRFVQWLKPDKIIPTVNVGDWKARNEMEKHFRDWKMGAAM